MCLCYREWIKTKLEPILKHFNLFRLSEKVHLEFTLVLQKV